MSVPDPVREIYLVPLNHNLQVTPMAKGDKNTKRGSVADNPLKTFMSEFQELLNLIPREAEAGADDADVQTVIKSFAQVVRNQSETLSDYLVGTYDRASKQQKLDVDQVLLMTSGEELATNGKAMLPSIGSIAGKLGLSRVVKEIKKIVRLVIDALGIALPRWMDGLLNLMDEILDAILSAGSAKLATTLSIQEQNYLAELTHLARLQQANQFRFQVDDEEE